MAERLLTHSQYEQLRRYEHGSPSWMRRPRLGGTPSKSLIRNGYLAIPKSGHARASSLFRITDAGSAALVAYRARWGIRVSAGGAEGDTDG